MQRFDLVVNHRTGEVEVHLTFEARAEPGCSPAVGNEHDESLIGEPLRAGVRVAGGDDALGVRSAVRVEQHWQLRRAVTEQRGVARYEHGTRDAAAPNPEDVWSGLHECDFCSVLDRAHR